MNEKEVMEVIPAVEFLDADVAESVLVQLVCGADALAVASTCQMFAAVLRSDSVWRTFYLHEFSPHTFRFPVSMLWARRYQLARQRSAMHTTRWYSGHVRDVTSSGRSANKPSVATHTHT